MLSLYVTNKALCHEDIWGSGGIAPPIMTLALDGEVSGQLHAPGEQTSCTRWIGGWVSPRASLGA
jgi:hypothetical protein